MRQFYVRVNGREYEVEIEEITAGSATAAPVQQPAAAPQPAVSKAAPVSGEALRAPLPGNILEVKVSAGDHVQSGQVLMILEAMKMENEILAPHDGVIASVAVQKGATVASGDVLVSFQ